MEGLAAGFIIKSFLSHSKVARPLLVSLFLLFILAFTHAGTLMETLNVVWCALAGLLQNPALAFLLVNCVIITIIASSRPWDEKRGREEEISEENTKGQSKEKTYEKRGSLHIHAQAGSPQHQKSTSHSSFDRRTKADGQSRPGKHLAVEGAVAKPHPSMEEVWAAIMASNGADNYRMAQNPHAGLIRSREAVSSQLAAAAAGALIPPPPPDTLISSVLLHSSQQPGTPAAMASQPRRAAKGVPFRPHVAASEKQLQGEEDNKQTDHREVEELNRRAGEFIARFNHQMRLQREESLQRQKRGCRPARSYNPQYSAHGLVVR